MIKGGENPPKFDRLRRLGGIELLAEGGGGFPSLPSACMLPFQIALQSDRTSTEGRFINIDDGLACGMIKNRIISEKHTKFTNLVKIRTN